MRSRKVDIFILFPLASWDTWEDTFFLSFLLSFPNSSSFDLSANLLMPAVLSEIYLDSSLETCHSFKAFRTQGGLNVRNNIHVKDLSFDSVVSNQVHCGFIYWLGIEWGREGFWTGWHCKHKVTDDLKKKDKNGAFILNI